MTDVVIPSRDRTALANAEAATNLDGPFERVIPSDERALELPEANLSTGSLAAFDLLSVSSSGGLDSVTIDTGEAFIGGAYLARDTQTTVTLSDAEHTVGVGWDHTAPDGVQIQDVSEFAARDRYLPLWTVQAGNGVGDATDERELDRTLNTDITAGNVAVDEISSQSGDIRFTDTLVLPNSEMTPAVQLSAFGVPLLDVLVTVGGIVEFQRGVNGKQYFRFAGSDSAPVVEVPDAKLAAQSDVSVETVLELVGRPDDPSNPVDGSLWYRSDLDEYRGVENGSVVSFNTTQV